MVLFGGLLSWLSDKALDLIQGAASKALRTVFFSLSTLIYKLVISLYDLFDILCYGRILDNEVLKDLSTRIGYVLGVIMLFFVILSFVNMLLNPDTLSDKNKGAVNIIKKTILVIVMLGVSNYFFQLLYSVQRVVVQNHVVSKLLLPYEVDTEHFGGALSAELFTAFYNVSLSYIDSDGNIMGDDENVQLCQQEVYTMKEQIAEHSDFSLGDVCLNTSTTYTAADGEDREDFIIDFNWLLSVGVGIFAIYILTVYCIKVGIRMIQLAFLEIISPMAIVSYLSPKQDTMFSKWSKIYFSTYIDVFIRIAIINFSVYLIAVIFGSGTDKTFWESFEINGSNPIWTKRFIMIAMVLALLAFAKKAPELLKELLPASASKLGFGGMKWNDMLGGNYVKGAAKIATAGSAIGLLGAASSGYSRYKINRKNGASIPKSVLGGLGGVMSAIPRGLKAGAAKGNIFSNVSKGWENQRSVDDKYDELITGGGSTVGKFTSHVSAHFGETKGQMYNRIITNNEQVSKSVKNLEDMAENFKNVKIARTSWENAKARGATDAEINDLYDRYKMVKDNHITAVLQGHAFENSKDQSVAESMKVFQSEITAMLDSGKVVLNRDDGSVIRGSDLTDSSSIDAVSVATSRNISSIKMQPDFSSAFQNDKSAGVNSNGKK